MSISDIIATYRPSWLSWDFATPAFIIVIIVATIFFVRLVNRILLGYFKKMKISDAE